MERSKAGGVVRSVLPTAVAILAVALFLARVSPLGAQTLPDCCSPGSTPGCEVEICETCVCAIDPICCDPEGTWDVICVGIAETECGFDCPCESCCAAHEEPGCNDAACETCVCELDSACCSIATGWDDNCVDQATAECAADCPCVEPGDCCLPTGSAGCGDATCEACVCGLDSECCDDPDVGWDLRCVDIAAAECLPVCFCAGEGDCCEPHGGPGCENRACLECVCGRDGQCCDAAIGWDEICVAEATDPECADACACAPARDCCDAHADTGCDDITCEDCVCGLDDRCCDDPEVGWDDTCASIADDECLSSCFCPRGGSCCDGHDDIGCDQFLCVECTCTLDPTCCTDVWDPFCADIASTDCAPRCNCPLLSNCCLVREEAGCEEAACEACACGVDDFCCRELWDKTCTAIATVECKDDCSCDACIGDCEGDGFISISNLVVGINIALGDLPLVDCFPMDANGDGRVAIDELLGAVTDALNGC